VAAAALLLLGLAVRMGPLLDGTLAWADVQTAFLGQHWVHVAYDNGSERWYDLLTGNRAFKDWDGRCVYIEHGRNLRWVYEPSRGASISEDRPVIYEDDVIPQWEPQSAWEAIVGYLEKAPPAGIGRHQKVKREIEPGLVRFDTYYTDAIERRLLIEQVWADPQSRLPVRIRKRLGLAQRKEQGCEYIEGRFDFPDTGPMAIYDLGVSRDLPVSIQHDRPVTPSVLEIMETARAAKERFPSQYRLVKWNNGRESDMQVVYVDVVWRDGKRVRLDHYFNMSASQHTEFHLRLPADVSQVLDWTKTQPPVEVCLFDGSRQYIRRHHPAYDDLKEPQVRVIRSDSDEGFAEDARVIEGQWPYIRHNPSAFQIIQDPPEELARYVGLRSESEDIRREIYVDPEHDGIYVKWIWWKRQDGVWHKEREYTQGDLTRLPGGQWYAQRRDLITYADTEQGTSQGGAQWSIHVNLLTETDYPPDLYNGERLLEDVQKIETF
jgi:hypothetical protein